MTTRPVYLDQADWSYLHAGTATQVEERLRRAGIEGRAAYLVSLHHFEESNGLQAPDERVGYLRSFPGTALVTVTAYDLVAFEARKLAGLEGAQAGFQITLTRLSDVSASDFEALTTGFRRARRLRPALTPLYERRRELHRLDLDAVDRRGGRKNPHDDLALWRALLRGDAEHAIEVWERVMRATATPAERDAIAAEATVRSQQWKQGEAAGLLPPSDLDFDETFVHAVFQLLPPSIRSDRARLSIVLNNWAEFSRAPSPLSCFASVVHGVLRNPSRAYESTSQVDALHAAFAPLVDIFTCDKRTRDDLKRIRLKAMVLCAGRLEDVAVALEGGRVSR